MLVVNLAGAPGAGKSTGAAYIFSKLKMKGINAELVTEYAKDKVWEEDKAVFDNQVYIFGKQLFRLTRLEGKVDVVITDRSIYYRLTEVSPDWFKAIHNSVLKHNLDIDDVTICIDPQSTGSPIKYAHYGTKQITYVPTKELLLTCEGDFGKYAID